MKHALTALLLCAAISMPCANAQTEDELNEGTAVEWDSANTVWRFKWFGRQGRTYFIQQNTDPRNRFDFVPVIETGDGSVREWGFTTSGDRLFLRLKSTDISTTDPWNDDFDGDGVSNYSELLGGTDPLVSDDAGGNGLPDYWEDFHFGYSGVAAADDPDADGLTNLQEFQSGTSPSRKDNPAVKLQATAIVR